MDYYVVLTADVYRAKYGAKYFGLPVVRYFNMSNRVLKMIRCLTGSQRRDFKIGVTRKNLEAPGTKRAKQCWIF